MNEEPSHLWYSQSIWRIYRFSVVFTPSDVELKDLVILQ